METTNKEFVWYFQVEAIEEKLAECVMVWLKEKRWSQAERVDREPALK